jgi:undecaprenyl diphosphate synthase
MKHFLAWASSGSRELELANRIDPKRLPRHIAVIMDGNGRWAKKQFLPRAAGHRAGVESVRSTIEACSRLEIDALTLYAFSVENWKRPKDEVNTLWSLLLRYLRQELDSLTENGVRLKVIGRTAELPAEVQTELASAVARTAANTGLTLTVALNYGGRSEIVDAVNQAIAEARSEGDDVRVDESSFEKYLYTVGLPDPDLLIRTSGEVRVSNFLLWQIAYTEIWVTDKLWPDFREADLLEAILDFQGRERRFGGLSDAPSTKGDEPALVGASASSSEPPAAGDFSE